MQIAAARPAHPTSQPPTNGDASPPGSLDTLARNDPAAAAGKIKHQLAQAYASDRPSLAKTLVGSLSTAALEALATTAEGRTALSALDKELQFTHSTTADRANVTAALQKGLEAEKAELLLDLAELGLSITGIVDPTPLSDTAAAGIALKKGDLQGAMIGVVGAAVPYLGDLAKAGRLPQLIKVFDRAAELARVDPAFLAAIRPVAQRLHATLEALPLDKLPAALQQPLQELKTKLSALLQHAASRLDDAGQAAAKFRQLTPDMLDKQGHLLGRPNAGPNAPRFDNWLKAGNKVEINPDGTFTYINKKGVSVHYDAKGFPDFAPHLTHPSGVKSVEIEPMRGDHNKDYRQANIRAGHPEWGWDPPEGYTWHHHQNGQTMQLVPEGIHREFKHAGGAAAVRNRE